MDDVDELLKIRNVSNRDRTFRNASNVVCDYFLRNLLPTNTVLLNVDTYLQHYNKDCKTQQLNFSH